METNIQDLLIAMNEPNSPLRAKLLHNLAMSPLDPAVAYQQLSAQLPDMQMGGLPPQGGNTSIAPMSAVLDGGTQPELQADPMTPQMSTRPPFDFTAGGDASTPPIVPQTGEDPKLTALKKVFEGASLVGGNADQRPYPSASMPSNNWRGFTAAQFDTPNVAAPSSLAQILNWR
jgi:hypothetical protein